MRRPRKTARRLAVGASALLTAAIAGILVGGCAEAEGTIDDDAGPPSVAEVLAEIAALELPDEELDALLYERALEEGEVVHYGTGTSLTEEQTAAFTAAYPGIELRYVGGRASEISERVMAEHRADRLQADVVHSSAVVMALFGAEGVLVPHAGVVVPDGFPAGRVDELDITFRLGPYVTLWNTDLVADEDAPRQWDDHLRPEHAGCVIVDGPNWFSTMISERGIEAMEVWVETFLANGGEVRSGVSATTAAVASGEFSCMVGTNVGRAEALIVDDGAPLAWHVPDGAPSHPFTIGVTARAANPYAAALFVRWALGRDGQTVLAQGGDVSVLPGVDGPYERLAPFSDPDHAYSQRLVLADPDRIVELEEQATELMARLLNMAGD